MTSPRVDPKTHEVKVGFRNSGHTPARMTAVVYGQFFKNEIPNGEYEDRLYFHRDLSLTQPTGLPILTIGADTMSIESERVPFAVLDVSDFKDINGLPFQSTHQVEKQLATNILYFWGAVLYEDVDHDLHERKFCYIHRPKDGMIAFGCSSVDALDEPVNPSQATCVSPQVAGPPKTDHAHCIR